MKRAALTSYGLALLAGLAHAQSIATPWDGQPAWWLQLASLGVLAFLLARAQGAWQGARLGGVFATAWLTGTFWWLFISMHVYGGLAAPLAAFAVLALAAFLAAYYALASAAAVSAQRAGAAWGVAAFAAAWLLAELARATLFTGFPWGEAGYAHVDGPLAFLAPQIGVHGISFIAALLAAGLAQLARPGSLRSWRHWALAAGAAGLLAACNIAAAPPAAGPGAPRLSVALLQGNIPQDEKFETGTGIPLALTWYGEQLRDASASLVVAPETAIPLLPSQLPEGYQAALAQRFHHGPHAALVGMPLGGFSEGYTNSALGFAPGLAQPYRYDKHHLVPFGEFIPPWFKWFTRMMNIPLGDFNRGSSTQPAFEWQGQRLAPNVCYEDLFGEELALRFAEPARAPTMFVNLSNIAWFGNTVAIDQHLHISRMRALEFDRPMLRATNTGATVIIDHRARVTHSLPRHTRGVLVGEAQGRDTITPYAAWASRWGLWPLSILAVALLAAALGRAARRPTGKAA